MNKRRRDQRQMTTSGSRPLSTQPVLTKLRRDQPLPQAVTAVEIPPPWRDQSAVAEGVYFTIPPGLLDMVAESVGRDRFVAEELRRERALGQAADMEHGNVGFDRGRPIAYQFLAPPPPTAFHSDLLAQAAKEWGMTVGALTNSIQMSAERSATLHNPLRGYVGWLLTSREFLDEHDQLIDHHWTRIRADGMPQPLWGIAGGEELRLVNEDDWVVAYRTFCERWRLQSLAAPSLPVPVEPQVPAHRPATSLPPGIVNIVFPDTSPTLGRGVLDESLEDTLHASPPEHLAGWIEIVSKDTPAKTQMAVFERRCRLQHFWRLLHQRFPQALRQTKIRLTAVFADFLNVSGDTVKHDLRDIGSRLGDGWELRLLTPQ